MAMAAGSFLAACGGSGGSSTAATSGAGGGGGSVTGSVRTQLSWIKNVEYAGQWIGLSEGYYAKEGVNASFLPLGAQTPGAEQVVASGGADVGMSASMIPTLAAIEQGADFVIFATTFQENPSGLLSLPDNPVEKPEDMVGKRIGIQANSDGEKIVDACFEVNGLPKDRSFVPVGFDPTPLVEGACDAYTCFVTNQPITLKSEGIPYVARTYNELNLPTYGNFFFAERSYLEENHDLLVGWLRATAKGWQRNVADPNLGLEVTLNEYGKGLGLEKEEQELENKAQIPLLQSSLTKKKGLLWVSPEDVENAMYDGLRAAGMENLPPVEKLVDTSILEDAFEGQKTIQ